MLKTTNITKSYRGKKILNGVTIDCPPGMYSCLVGKNGSGKSTLLGIMSGMISPDSGEVLLNNKNIRSREAARDIGYVPQADNLFEHLSAYDNLRFWGAAAGVKKHDPAVASFAHLFGLSTFWKQKVITLSGGQRRRVAICAALLHNPACLLLDEPFTGLDLVVKDELFATLDELCRAGKTILYTTHNIDEINTGGKLLILRDGAAADVCTDEISGDFRAFMLNLLR